MRTFAADDGYASIAFGAQPVDVGFADRPVVALLYAVTGRLMELLGPIFWAALIILFVRAELAGWLVRS